MPFKDLIASYRRYDISGRILSPREEPADLCASVLSAANSPPQIDKNQSLHQNIDFIVKTLKINNIQKITRHKNALFASRMLLRDVISQVVSSTLIRPHGALVVAPAMIPACAPEISCYSARASTWSAE